MSYKLVIIYYRNFNDLFRYGDFGKKVSDIHVSTFIFYCQFFKIFNNSNLSLKYLSVVKNKIKNYINK